jgi:redox-sensitive bicupin YhaK (pirin superfamily)
MATATTGSLSIQRSSERTFFDHGWLKTFHSFSFAEYDDPENVHWGALRVFNDDVVEGGRGFGAHPHNNMEILTYVLSGGLEHKDSIGNTGVVCAGGVQYLSAGTGIMHAEYNHNPDVPLRIVQMWVLPDAPGHKPRDGQVDYVQAERLNRWLVIASGRPDVPSRIPIWQDAAASVARLENHQLSHTIGPDRFGFLFVAEGEVLVNGQELHAGDAARVAGPFEIEVQGSAELVLWDVPQA